MRTRTYKTIVWQFQVALAVGLAAAALGCQQGAEGDYCNPDLSHNECNSGLVCTQPPLCPESYCCPPDLKDSTNPFCAEGCAGGAQAICEADPMADAACAFNAEHPFDGGYKEPD
jgi:hypothetical protein